MKQEQGTTTARKSFHPPQVLFFFFPFPNSYRLQSGEHEKEALANVMPL